MKLGYRVETRLFSPPVLILTVQYKKPYNYDPQLDNTPGGYVDCWRDATHEDITNIRLSGEKLSVC